MLRRLAIATAVGLVAWLGVLLILGYVLGSRQERGTKERLAESLHATTSIETSDLALIRGRWQFEQLAVRRDDAAGHLSIDVAQVRCELGPFGWALVDRDCSELALREMRLEVSSIALFKVSHPKHRPLHTDRLVLDQGVFVFLPTAITPSLGKLEITIEHAESGPTIMRSPMSWVFSLRELRAKAVLGDVTLQLTFSRGVLTVAGSLFAAPVVVPVTLPDASNAQDAADETALLAQFGKDVVQQVITQRAADWLKAKMNAPPAAP